MDRSPGKTPEWVDQFNKAIPAIIAGGVLWIGTLIWDQTGAVKAQQKQLDEMAKTLKMVCDQLGEKNALDAVQNVQIKALQSDVEDLMQR